jgi:hypothetical protein
LSGIALGGTAASLVAAKKLNLMRRNAKNNAKNAKNTAKIMQNNAGVRGTGSRLVIEFRGVTPDREWILEKSHVVLVNSRGAANPEF